VVVVTLWEHPRRDAERRSSYGYARNHRATHWERERWEAARRYNDHR